jgi:hypothetical protein
MYHCKSKPSPFLGTLTCKPQLGPYCSRHVLANWRRAGIGLRAVLPLLFLSVRPHPTTAHYTGEYYKEQYVIAPSCLIPTSGDNRASKDVCAPVGIAAHPPWKGAEFSLRLCSFLFAWPFVGQPSPGATDRRLLNSWAQSTDALSSCTASKRSSPAGTRHSILGDHPPDRFRDPFPQGTKGPERECKDSSQAPERHHLDFY